MESGRYEIQIGKSASEILLFEDIEVEGEKVIPKVYTLNSTFGEVMADPQGRAILEMFGKNMNVQESMAAIADSEGGEGVISQEMIAAMMEGMPLRTIMMFAPGVQPEMLGKLVEALNAE